MLTHKPHTSSALYNGFHHTEAAIKYNHISGPKEILGKTERNTCSSTLFMKSPPSQLWRAILSLNNLYRIHYVVCDIRNIVIVVAVRMSLVRTKNPTRSHPILSLDWHGLNKKLHPSWHKNFLCVAVECNPNTPDGIKYVSKWRHGFVGEAYSSGDFSNLPTEIYLWILKGAPSHSLGLVVLSNHGCLSQLFTTVVIRSHYPMHFKSYTIVTTLPSIASFISRRIVSWK